MQYKVHKVFFWASRAMCALCPFVVNTLERFVRTQLEIKEINR